MTARNYAILYIGKGGASSGGSAVLGGDAVLDTEQHALDGLEHSAAADLTRLNASILAHGLLPKLSGDVGDALRGDGSWVAVADSTLLLPDATITATKDTANPTFDFASLPENIIKVGATYYCPYINTPGAADLRMATATDRDGPWTAYGGTPLLSATSVAWRGTSSTIQCPEIVENGGTFYMFYEMLIPGGATLSTNAIGVATCATVDGTYVDSGAAILSPGAGAAWDSRRVGEPSVTYHAGQWVMAYMGETSAAAYGDSEKIGIATAPSPTGPWTKAAGNPVIDFGTSGEWDDSLIADPHLFFYNGYYWIWYAGAPTSTPTTFAEEGFAYATDPEGPYTRFAGNPVLSPGASGAWDDVHVFRGGLLYEDGQWSGVYCGYDGANYKGGNFRLDIVSSGEVLLRAADIPIDDLGGYYTGAAEVETALQEIGADLAVLVAGGLGHYEVIVSGTAPPVAVTNEAEDDWLYGFVAG